MTDDFMRAEQISERRRARGDFRRDPATTDIHKHEPTPDDRRVEPPLDREESR